MSRTHYRPILISLCILFAAVSFTGAAAPQDKVAAPAAPPAANPPAVPPPSTPAPPAAPEKPEFVGSDTCQACHEDIFNSWVKSPHHIVEITPKRGFKGHGCESCHG